MAQSNDQAAELAAIQEIRTLVHLYAHHVLHGRGDAIADLYAEDGAFVVTRGPVLPTVDVRGREQIRAFHKTMVPGTVFPLIANQVITVAGETATATCAMYSPRSGRHGVAGAAFYGEYADSFVRVDGRWRFRERSFVYYS